MLLGGRRYLHAPPHILRQCSGAAGPDPASLTNRSNVSLWTLPSEVRFRILGGRAPLNMIGAENEFYLTEQVRLSRPLPVSGATDTRLGGRGTTPMQSDLSAGADASHSGSGAGRRFEQHRQADTVASYRVCNAKENSQFGHARNSLTKAAAVAPGTGIIRQNARLAQSARGGRCLTLCRPRHSSSRPDAALA